MLKPGESFGFIHQGDAYASYADGKAGTIKIGVADIALANKERQDKYDKAIRAADKNPGQVSMPSSTGGGKPPKYGWNAYINDNEDAFIASVTFKAKDWPNVYKVM